MTAGRKLRPPPEIVDIEKTFDQPRFANAMDNMIQEGKALTLAESQRVAAIRAVSLQVGYQLPGDGADPDLIQRDISANMRRSVEACLEVGRGLSVLKVACEHGQFIARLDVLGIDRKVAAKFMQAASKFANVSSTRHLTAALGNQTKLFEMLVLDDEQIEELELTGQTGELRLDDVATMSVKELRAKVRELRNEVTAKEEVLSKRSAQINTLEEKLSRSKSVPADEVLLELRQAAAKEFGQVKADISVGLYSVVRHLKDHHEANGGDSEEFLAGLAGEIKKALRIMCDELFIADISEKMIPEWITDPRFNELSPDSSTPPKH